MNSNSQINTLNNNKDSGRKNRSRSQSNTSTDSYDLYENETEEESIQITTKYISSKSSKSFIGWVQEVLWNTLPFHFSTILLLMLALYFRLWMSGHYAPIVFTKAENPAS